ncbi:Serine/threonine-protein kinase pkn1 [Marinomonas gallaica]|uniref:Serine/threonine-protein kinase pkn1 n=1 Tax=Marinomonas gallaica TaxID=1806667 RepID=A0A1C3JUT7_9GAMM|nr:SUMF1/EgtB/PvdO family nonheme iron enzyme [Marinomonas gallaica]SBT18875.1 Serine/threonine-protein kinase pkn1 [Marinomonas gallaica]SBT21830.1 Serine/threonine-protein kinase pkn1 [Marinomonas gallaica]
MNQYYDVSKLSIGQQVGVEVDPYVLNYPLSDDKSVWVADQGGQSFVLRFYRSERGDVNQFLSIARRHAKLKHPAITRSYPPFYSNLWVFSIYNLCGGERLFSYLGKYPDGASLNIVLSIFDPIAKALDQVHQHGYIHGHLDLSSVHVVNGAGILTGFGTHSWLDKITDQDMDGRFIPPEYTKRNPNISVSSDHYMFMRLLIASLVGESWLDNGKLNNLPDHVETLDQATWKKIKGWARPAERYRPKSLVEVMRLLRANLFVNSSKANSDAPPPPRNKKPVALYAGAGLGLVAVTAIAATLLWPTPPPANTTTENTPTVTSESRFDGLPQVLEEDLNDGGKAPKVEKIAPATFQMGDINGAGDENESPVHEVNIPKGFYFSKNEVTFAQYDRFVAATGRPAPPDNGWGRGNRPVINVSWYDAKAYANWLSEQTGSEYRLPTEIEWEYSARAGSPTAYWYGNEVQPGYSVCDSCGSQWDGISTAPVGSQASNPLGIFDMHGNVAEWVEDCYHENYAGAPSTNQVWLSDQCDGRVLRGGSWFDVPTVGRSATRYRAEPTLRASNWGFRIVRLISP